MYLIKPYPIPNAEMRYANFMIKGYYTGTQDKARSCLHNKMKIILFPCLCHGNVCLC